MKDHEHCPMCQRHIKAGEEYDCYIEIFEDPHFFRVTKWHVIYPPDFWEEEEERERQYLAEREREKETIPIAA